MGSPKSALVYSFTLKILIQIESEITNAFKKLVTLDGWWWCRPLILALMKQRQADLCEF